ncbi:MAG: hypothetical protein WCQ41_10655, partial [Bacillota bacterium]
VVSIDGNTWTILRPITSNVGSIPVKVSASNGYVESAYSSPMIINIVDSKSIDVTVGTDSNPTEAFSLVAKNAPLYFKIVTKADATSLYVNFSEANYNESFVPNGTTVIKNGNVWTIYRPMKNSWASLNVYIKAKIGGVYGPIANPVIVVTY